MFLSNAVVPVFVFTILLNFIYVYYAQETGTPPTTPDAENKNFTKCEECVASNCYTVSKGVCIPSDENDPKSAFQCVECTKDANNNTQSSTEELCKAGCTDTDKSCICLGYCYSCVLTANYPNPNPSDCKLPITKMANDKCELVEFSPPTSAPPPSGGSPPATPTSQS
ncbi:hypothetical protein ACI65C_000280 [Semiaphis heraclei]